MGFGIKLVPGVRVRMSSRGIRVGVGPRWARAHVGSHGVGVSVGPKATRAYVGSSGAFVSSGVGPIQLGPGGPRIAVNVGPLKAVLGKRPTTMLAAGPFWLSHSSNLDHGKNSAPKSPSQGEGALLGRSRVQPDMKFHYAAYLDSLSNDGVRRRGTMEMFVAHVHSSLLDFAPVVALVERYSAPTRPVVPPVPREPELRKAAAAHLHRQGVFNEEAAYSHLQTEAAFKNAARDRLKARGKRYRAFQLGGRRNVRDEAATLAAAAKAARAAARAAWSSRVDLATQTVRKDIAAKREHMIGRVEKSFRRFLALDPMVNLLVMQAAFADNGGTAAPISLDGSALFVLMSFPEPAQSIWPEKTARTPRGSASVKRRSQIDVEEAYTQHVLLHTLATVKEAFATQPRIETVRIVVVIERGSECLKDLPVIAFGTFQRDETTRAIPDGDDEWDAAWTEVVDGWHRGLGDDFLDSWQYWTSLRGELVKKAQQALDDLHNCWELALDNGRLKSLGTLGEVIEQSDLDQLIGKDDEATQLDQLGSSIADMPGALQLPQFWDQVLAVADVRCEQG